MPGTVHYLEQNCMNRPDYLLGLPNPAITLTNLRLDRLTGLSYDSRGLKMHKSDQLIPFCDCFGEETPPKLS